MCIWVDHGDLLVELYLHIHSWMRASDKLDGTTGVKLRTREPLASTSIGNSIPTLIGFAKYFNFG